MKPVLTYLKQTPFYKQLHTLMHQHSTIAIQDTFDDIQSVLIGLIASMSDKNILIVHNNLFHAQKLYDRISDLYINVLFYPQDEFITTEMLAMSEALKIERLNTIKQLLEGRKNIVVTHPTGLIKKLIPKRFYTEAIKEYRLKDDINPQQFTQELVRIGYIRVPAVEKAGEFSVRGSLIDLFLVDMEHPIRIDFFDTEIDSIRVFNVNTQRSIQTLKTFTLFPRTEFFYHPEDANHIEKIIRKKLETLTMDDDTLIRVEHELEQLKQYQDQDRLARYGSFLNTSQETLSEYMDDPVVIYINHDAIKRSYKGIVNDLADWVTDLDDYPKLGFDFIKDMDRLYHDKTIYFNPFEVKTPYPSLSVRAKQTSFYQNNYHSLLKDLKKYDQHTTVLITLRDEKRIKQLIDLSEDTVPIKLLGNNDLPFEHRINIIKSDYPLTFEWFDTNFIVLNDASIFQEPEKQKIKYKTVFKDTKKIDHVKDLRKGDHIVHYEHGIGRFLGIETMHISNHTNDYIVIQYKGDDTLYIPVENIHLIQKFAGNESVQPRLNKLGSADWAKTKQRVRNKAKDIAADLIKLYAEREKVEGFQYSEDSELMHYFEADFLFEETPDQLKAIEDVKTDMESKRPMDRLICGDVGYGKTEIALRAAAKAALDNKQVAYLAPTTVLSRQHYYTFKDRLDKHGIKCALLNRFITPAKQKLIIEGIKKGSIDVVLGTHRLLSKDIVFKDLGLLIIDEEQRFGVEHKEKIKTMRTHIDVLSLSATPIPRTMQMALTGVKQMSLLETPPKNRYPIQTYVLQRNDHVIKDAIERELARGGQTFYLYNRVETIENIQDKLTRLIPDARIVYAHGKMSRLRLERVIEDFLDHKFDVLVSTTIIETGIDIPNANTLIIHDADQLGLAQLYQIRGRVGRSDRIAYSYLMYQKNKQLSDEALKRLQVIKEFTELGSGYKIAIRDLSIRGAGDLLGTEQSGFIDSVGIDLFLEILKEEIEREKHHTVIDKSTIETAKQRIKFDVDKTIPESYIEEDDMRIEVHRKINGLTSSTDLILLKEELEDRFGSVPPALQLYMIEKLYEYLAVDQDIEKIYQQGTRIQFVFSANKSKTINGERLFSQTSELSPFIFLSYKKERIHLTIESHQLDKHFLYYMVEVLEQL